MLPSDDRHPPSFGSQQSEAAPLRRYLGAASRSLEHMDAGDRTGWVCYLLELLEPHPLERQERADYDAWLHDLAAAISERANGGMW